MITYLNKSVGELMTSDFISVKPLTIMTEVVNIFKNNTFQHIPVLNEQGNCVGIISKKDYLQLQDQFTLLDGKNCENINDRFMASLLAKEVMTKEIISLTSDILASDAIKIFLTNKVHSIIVTDGEKCKGIITPFDLLEYFGKVLSSYQKAIV